MKVSTYLKDKFFLFILFIIFFFLMSYNTNNIIHVEKGSVIKAIINECLYKPDTIIGNCDYKFDILYLDRIQFENLLDSLHKVARCKGKQRVVFQFYHKLTDTMTLAAWPGKRRNKKFGSLPLLLNNIDTVSESFINLCGMEAFVGDQQWRITNGFIDSVRNYNSQQVIFIPKIDADKHLYYDIALQKKSEVSFKIENRASSLTSSPGNTKSHQIFKVDKTTYVIAARTDPSPPAPAK